MTKQKKVLLNYLLKQYKSNIKQDSGNNSYDYYDQFVRKIANKVKSSIKQIKFQVRKNNHQQGSITVIEYELFAKVLSRDIQMRLSFPISMSYNDTFVSKELTIFSSNEGYWNYNIKKSPISIVKNIVKDILNSKNTKKYITYGGQKK